MENCPTDMELESQVLQSLQQPDLPVPEHIQACAFCQERWTELRHFYADFQTSLESSADLDLLQAIEARSLGRDPHRLKLVFLPHSLQLRPPSEERQVLAADGGTHRLRPHIKNVGVFTSADGRLLLRILKDQAGETTLYLLADAPELYQHVLVHIPSLDAEFISDAQGCVALGQILLPPSEDLEIEVQSALGSYDLKTIFPRSGQFVGECQLDLVPHEQRRIKLEIQPQGQHYTLKVSISEERSGPQTDTLKFLVMRDDHHLEMQSAAQGVACFQDIQDPAQVRIKIFA